MIGDRINPELRHQRAARAIFDALGGSVNGRTTFTVAGQSGAGKSEVAWEFAKILDATAHRTLILQQDDYFHYPPRTNHNRRVDDIEWVGTQEVDLALLDRHLATFKGTGSTILEKPLVVFEEDRMTTENVDLAPFQCVIAEGTYTTLLENADHRIFIDRDFHDTLADRQARGREKIDDFSERVLKIEDRIISKHKTLADIIVKKDFSIEIVDRP